MVLDGVSFLGTNSLQVNTKEFGMKVLRGGAIFLAASIALVALAPSAEGAGPFQYFAVTPCRAIDTRSSSRIQRVVAYNVTIKGTCGVPLDAAAVSLNVTVVNPSGAGWLAMWPKGAAPANVSTLNFLAGEPAIANGAIAPLAAATTPDLTLWYNGTMTTPESTDAIIDVTGYFK